MGGPYQSPSDAIRNPEQTHGFENQGNPQGFVDRTHSSMTFTDGTRTFEIAPLAPATEFAVYLDSKKYVKDVPESIVITDTEGVWFIYYDASGVLTVSQTPWNLLIHISIALVYWNAATNTSLFMAEERHGIGITREDHVYKHNNIGTLLSSGGNVGNYTTTGNGDLDAHAQISVANTTIWDEDIRINIAHSAAPANEFEQVLSAIAEIPIYYQDGVSGVWRKKPANTFPIFEEAGGPGTRIGYNDLSGAPTITEVANGNFAAVFILATDAISEPIIGILGQRSDGSIANASDNNDHITLDLAGIPAQEFRFLARLIFQTGNGYANAVKARLRDVIDLRRSSPIPTNPSSPIQHNALNGRDDAASHPLRAIRWGTWVVQTADQVLGISDGPQAIDTSGIVDVTLTLPPSASAETRIHSFKWVADAGNVAKVAADGGDADGIDGAVDFAFATVFDSIFIVPNETLTGWWIV